MTDLPHVIAGQTGVSEEHIRVLEAYQREHDIPYRGMRHTAAKYNEAVDWWNALGPDQREVPPEPDPRRKLTMAEWRRVYGVHVFDPDGWRKPDAPGPDDPITLVEFWERARSSTVDAASLAWDGVRRDARTCANMVAEREGGTT